MYDLPELTDATDRFWAAIRDRLRDAGVQGVPAALTRQQDLEALWTDPRLLFSQTCGWPLMHRLRGRLTPIATPVFDLPGTEGGRYRSFVVVGRGSPSEHVEALRGAVCAVNGWDSQSGWNVLAALVAPFAEEGRFFRGAIVTGSHVGSLGAVSDGAADVAAIDCVSFGLLARHRPAAVAGVRIVAETESAPGLPFVARTDLDPALREALVAAVRDACSAPDTAGVRAPLAIVGSEAFGLEDYEAIVTMTARGIPHPPVSAATGSSG